METRVDDAVQTSWGTARLEFPVAGRTKAGPVGNSERRRRSSGSTRTSSGLIGWRSSERRQTVSRLALDSANVVFAETVLDEFAIGSTVIGTAGRIRESSLTTHR
jgi:hypothetical protein